MRKTKITCTIGPKTDSIEMLEKLASAGMNIVRLNMSHGDHTYAGKIIANVRKLNKKLQFPIAILLDTQGPEIRIGQLPEDMDLKQGDIFKLSIDSACDPREIQNGSAASVNYQGLTNSVKKGDTILIDDGMIALEVVEVEQFSIKCKVLNKGRIKSRKCVNLPGVKVDIPAVTEKDIADIEFGVREDVDFVALSFVRHQDDVLKVRQMLQKKGSRMQIIAKIEHPDAVQNMEHIIEAADGIMVARGDLGVEMPFEEVPILQKKIVRKCIRQGKPVIIATHLLESMINNPRPTRAEVTDVANAVFDGTDSIMLSGETTVGAYPIECVKTMDKIARRVEREFTPPPNGDAKVRSVKEEIARDACINAESLNAKAILVFTRSGRLARLVVKHRPSSNVYLFTEDEKLRRQLMLQWGALSFKIPFGNNYEKMVQRGLLVLRKGGFAEVNKLVVIVSDANEKGKHIDTLEVRQIM
ncbi:pyruvate kinase [Candidatus Woesearchaeota archaeon]|nr:pyruvate kinase [Candidatus Woesearchaeota archaeon]